MSREEPPKDSELGRYQQTISRHPRTKINRSVKGGLRRELTEEGDTQEKPKQV